MAKPPQNYKIGQARGRATQSLAARAYDTKVWDWILTLAIWEKPRTLREYAELLNQVGVSTAHGGPWTTGLIHRVMKTHGVTAKSLLDRVTRPSPFEPRTDWLPSVYQAYKAAVEAIDDPSAATGRWVTATHHEPQPSDLIRCGEEEGLLVRQTSLGRFLCYFTPNAVGQEIECSAAELEVFQFFLSRRERLEATLRARERIFR